MAIWGLFFITGGRGALLHFNGSKAAEVEMSTRVLIKVSTCVWICKVLGLRSNHRFVFSSVLP